MGEAKEIIDQQPHPMENADSNLAVSFFPNPPQPPGRLAVLYLEGAGESLYLMGYGR